MDATVFSADFCAAARGEVARSMAAEGDDPFRSMERAIVCATAIAGATGAIGVRDRDSVNSAGGRSVAELCVVTRCGADEDEEAEVATPTRTPAAGADALFTV